MTEEHKQKIGESQKGNHNSLSTEFKKGHPKYTTMGDFKKGNIPWNKDKKGVMPTPWNKDRKETRPEVIEKLSNSHKGIKQSEESKEKRRKALSGDKCYLYIDGRSKKKGYNAIYGKRYRARKKNAAGSHTLGEWELLKKQYGYICPCCGKCEPKITLTEDHIIPLDKGGSDYIENIQPLCRSCNSKKHTKIIRYGLRN